MRHSFALPILLHLYAAVVVTSYLKVSDQLACKTRSTLKYICPNIQLSAKSDENLDSLKAMCFLCGEAMCFHIFIS